MLIHLGFEVDDTFDQGWFTVRHMVHGPVDLGGMSHGFAAVPPSEPGRCDQRGDDDPGEPVGAFIETDHAPPTTMPNWATSATTRKSPQIAFNGAYCGSVTCARNNDVPTV